MYFILSARFQSVSEFQYFKASSTGKEHWMLYHHKSQQRVYRFADVNLVRSWRNGWPVPEVDEKEVTEKGRGGGIGGDGF